MIDLIELNRETLRKAAAELEGNSKVVASQKEAFDIAINLVNSLVKAIASCDAYSRSLVIDYAVEKFTEIFDYKRFVAVEVYSGIAEVTRCPDGVKVEIVDHDHR